MRKQRNSVPNSMSCVVNAGNQACMQPAHRLLLTGSMHIDAYDTRSIPKWPTAQPSKRMVARTCNHDHYQHVPQEISTRRRHSFARNTQPCSQAILLRSMSAFSFCAASLGFQADQEDAMHSIPNLGYLCGWRRVYGGSPRQPQLRATHQQGRSMASGDGGGDDFCVTGRGLARQLHRPAVTYLPSKHELSNVLRETPHAYGAPSRAGRG